MEHWWNNTDMGKMSVELWWSDTDGKYECGALVE